MMNICGIEYGPGVNEIAEAGFRTAESVRVKPPRLIDCPVQLECRLMDIRTLSHYDMVIGEIVFFHFRPDVVNERHHIDVVKLDPIGRLSGSGYVRVGEPINMPRLPVPPGMVDASLVSGEPSASPEIRNGK
jgi:flavin reductase (DIM6/NTAB) family NADH-FMN oxidoreductase RutF